MPVIIGEPNGKLTICINQPFSPNNSGSTHDGHCAQHCLHPLFQRCAPVPVNRPESLIETDKVLPSSNRCVRKIIAETTVNLAVEIRAMVRGVLDGSSDRVPSKQPCRFVIKVSHFRTPVLFVEFYRLLNGNDSGSTIDTTCW